MPQFSGGVISIAKQHKSTVTKNKSGAKGSTFCNYRTPAKEWEILKDTRFLWFLSFPQVLNNKQVTTSLYTLCQDLI